MSDSPTEPKTRKSGRGLRLALSLSLMLNVLGIGVLAGGLWHGAMMERMDPDGPDFRALWRAMPVDSRDDLRAMVRSREGGHEGDDHGHDRESRRARAADLNARILTALRADPFDSEAFLALLEVDRAGAARRLEIAHAAFAAQVADLTTAERQAMAERLEEDLRRRPRR